MNARTTRSKALMLETIQPRQIALRRRVLILRAATMQPVPKAHTGMGMRVCVSRVTSVRQYGTVLHHVQNARVHRRALCRTIVARTRIACLTQMVTELYVDATTVLWGVR